MFEKRTLKNGLRIVYENIPYVRSASVGVWVGSGSRYEKAAEGGASHFIEHMVFKGTGRRTALEIAELSDRIGGQINAFTTKECTCFYGRVLDEHILTLVDILYDMLTGSKFGEIDIENERGVIFEEIDMYEDSPEDLVVERLIGGIYKNALGKPILGKKSTLSKMDGDFLKSFMSAHYSPENIVISVSGSFKPGDIDNIAGLFSGLSGKKPRLRGAYYQPAFVSKKKRIEQSHICLGFPGLPTGSRRRYAFILLSNILGGSMSSRLFQNVREKRGLCYTIYSFVSSYIDTGMFGIYTATNDGCQLEAIRLILDEIDRINDSGVTEDELSLCKQQAESNILMSLESTSDRMNRLGRGELFLGRVLTPDEIIEEYDKITAEDILALSRSIFNRDNISFSAVGKNLPEDDYRNILRF